MTRSQESRIFASLIAVGIFACVSAWAADPPPAEAPATATSPALSPAVKELLNRLNSANTADRQAAQKQAATILEVLGQQEALQKLSEITPDADLKIFLQDRVAQLKMLEEARRVSNLPGISLNVKDAPLQEVLDALNQALNAPVKLESLSGPNFADSFTLNVTNKPFWEVFAALHQQHPLNLTGMSGTNPTLRISTGRTNPMPFAIHGPAIAFLNNISLQRTINLQADTPVRQSTLNLSLVLAFDPRLSVSRYQLPAVARAVDDQGHAFTSPSAPSGSYVGSPSYMSGSMMPIQSRSFTLSAPPEIGKTLSFTLETTADIAIGSVATTVEDVEKNLDKPITVGTRTYRISRFDTPAGTPSRISLSIVPVASPLAQPTEPLVTPLSSGANPPTAQFTIMDSTGRTVWRGAGTSSLSTTIMTSNNTPPYKLEIRVVTGTVSLPVRLQFKDIALP